MWLMMVVGTSWSAPRVFELPLSGRQQVDVPVERFGRVAVEVRSAEGAALQIVDRLAGPGPRRGIVGGEDGRQDLFVDVGQIRVLTHGPNGAEGSLRVEVTPFERLDDTTALPHERLVTTRLRDRTERAWWIDHDGDEALQVEIIGRHAADLRLWRDGTWLVESTPRCTTLEPTVGQPVRQCVLDVETERGVYELVAYGGAGEPWAEEAADDTLEVRWGLPDRAGDGRYVGRIGPTGWTRFRVDGSIDTAHVALEEHATVGLHLQSVGRTPFELGSPEATITDTSRIPVATTRASGSAEKVVAVEGPPGQRFTLTWFDAATRRSIPTGRKVLVTSMSTRRWQDDLPPTAVVSYREDGRDVLVDDVSVTVAPSERFEQRFNLLEETRFLLRVDTPGTHRIALSEGEADVIVEPFHTTPPDGYRSPLRRADAWQESLTPGLYVVTLRPRTPGVATVQVDRNDWSDVAQRTLTDARPVTLPPELRLPITPRGTKAHIVRTFGSSAVMGLQAAVRPLDLAAAHALSLRAGESWKTDVQTDRPTRIRAVRPDGEPLTLELNGQRTTTLEVPVGSWAITLHNSGDPVVAVLHPVETAEVARVEPERPASPPEPLRLTDRRPTFFDLDRGRTAVLRLDVGSDGLYHLQSTGLLATEGSLRSRVAFGLGRGEANGVGRNFRIARYLRSGSYQVTVGARGQSRGHLGVELAAVPMVDGGDLALDETARVTLPPETGVTYRFRLDDRQQVMIRSESPTGAYPCRLEDGDGWPVIRPASTCRVDTTLDPGEYVLRSLPSDVTTKRTTRVATRPLPLPLVGHGPFPIGTGTTVAKEWVEPVGDGDRPHDRFTFELPGDDQVTVTLSPEMTGQLRRGDDTVARLVPGRAWSGPLTAGTYTLVVQAARRGTGIPYTLTVGTRALQIGQRRAIRSPATLPVVVGQAALVTLRSEGMADVRARLLDADGAIVAANDDRPDGWDFQIATWLQPGTYELQLEHVGSNRSTTLEMEAPPEVTGEPLKLNAKPTTLPIGPIPTVHPLRLGNNRQLLAVQVGSDQNVGLAIQYREGDGPWTNLGDGAGREVATIVRRPPGTEVRLRIWSVDERSGQARTAVTTANDRSPQASALADGIPFDGIGAVRARNVRPGLFRLLGDRSVVALCPSEGQPCRPAPSIVAVDEDTVLTGPVVRLERADLTRPVPMELPDRPRPLGTGMTGLVALTARTGDEPPNLHLAGDHAAAPGDGATLAVGSGRVAFWGRGGVRVQAVPLDLERRTWDGRQELRLRLPPRSAVALELDDQVRTYPMALQHGVFARIGDGAVWADEESRQANLIGAERLTLANPLDEARSVTLAPAQADGRALTPDEALEWFAVTPAATLVPVEPGAGTLVAHNGTLRLRRPDGTIQTGSRVDAPDGGVVEVVHGAGWTALWSESTQPGPQRTATRLLRLDAPGVHRVSADGPFAAAIAIDGRRRVELRPEGGSVDVIVEGAGAEVGIRPLGDQPDVRVQTRMLEVPILTEGLGDSVLLQSGQDAWFRFEVAEDGPIGVGARASADRVEARIVAPTGSVRARGVVTMADLTAGSWYLVLSQPSGLPPVDVQPAVVGLARPDTGPPAEVVRSHLERAGLTVDGGAP